MCIYITEQQLACGLSVQWQCVNVIDKPIWIDHGSTLGSPHISTWNQRTCKLVYVCM